MLSGQTLGKCVYVRLHQRFPAKLRIKISKKSKERGYFEKLSMNSLIEWLSPPARVVSKQNITLKKMLGSILNEMPLGDKRPEIHTFPFFLVLLILIFKIFTIPICISSNFSSQPHYLIRHKGRENKGIYSVR